MPVPTPSAGSTSPRMARVDRPVECAIPERIADRPASLAVRYRSIRAVTTRLARPLSPEDAGLQSMTEASPTKWHLGHTTWFFEQFVLLAHEPCYERRDERYHTVFNSYYNAFGTPYARSQRGMLTRPSLSEVLDYRSRVDEAVVRLIERGVSADVATLIELGLQHEQQHQELVITDVKHALAQSPLASAYHRVEPEHARAAAEPLSFVAGPDGVQRCGYDPSLDGAFSYDIEGPAHRVFLEPFEMATRAATNAEYLEFVRDGGYSRPEFWLDMGWKRVRAEGWERPLYWLPLEDGGAVHAFTLSGVCELDPHAPVTHLSLFEADAFARWASARLPTEQEWEAFCRVSWDGDRRSADLLDESAEAGSPLHPRANGDRDEAVAQGSRRDSGRGRVRGLVGGNWEWTGSQYRPYPGYTPPPGAVGEYNGKFMCNQFVLRGGSVATPRSHVRVSYRNFFPPESRWQFAGVRLARDTRSRE